MKNHFLIPYAGNKRQEVEQIYNSIKDNINDIVYIVEPFCGTSAFSYFLSTKHPKKFKYILNDNNHFLFQLYQTAKDERLLNNLIDELNKLFIPFPTKEQYNIIAKRNDFISWVFTRVIYAIRPGLYPIEKLRSFSNDRFNNFKDAPIVKFLRNEDVTILNNNWQDVYLKYKKLNNAFIFLDPPYLSSCNDYYLDPSVNVYEYLFNNDIDKENALICLCLENIWIIQLLFKSKKSITYNKTYELSKKSTTHIIILNNKLFNINEINILLDEVNKLKPITYTDV